MAKIVVLGIDGLNSELVKKWSEELPSFSKMQAEGIWGSLKSPIPPNPVVSWISAQTSTNPGQFGFWDQIYRDEMTYGSWKKVDSTKIKPMPLYKFLSFKRAKKVAIINVPFSWPAPEIPGGYAIANSNPPDEIERFTWPKSLRNEINDVVGEYLIDTSTHDAELFTMEKEHALDRLYKIDEQRFTLLNHFIKNKQCDYIFCVITACDRILRLFYQFPDKYNEDDVKNIIKYIDKQVGHLQSNLDDDTALLIHSVNNLQKSEGCFNLNEWLIEQKYLVLQEYPNNPTNFDKVKVDWGKTKAWAIGCDGQIYLNMEGREAEGIISSSQYESVIKELREKLSKLTYKDGSPIKIRLLNRDDIHSGPLTQFGPDLFLLISNGRLSISDMVGYGKGCIYNNEANCNKVNYGINGYFIIAGPGVTPEGEKKNVSVMDIAPTILAIMGEKTPNYMEGKSLVSIVASEEGKVFDRLAALGY